MAAAGEETAVKKTKPKAGKKKKKAVAKGRTDEELFGNTDDIFGDLPEAKPKSPKVKKKKKKVESAAVAPPTGEGEGETAGELLTDCTIIMYCA